MARRTEWIERVRRYEQSGLDLAEFAQGEGLPPEQLDGWCRAVRASQPRHVEPLSQATGIATPTAASGSAPAPAPAWIDIVLPNGDLVRLLPEADAATLACVLAVAAELSSGRPRGEQSCALPLSSSKGKRK